ncbi:MAG: NUDIX hydrolase [Anaerolineales bacterium]
MSAIFPNVRSTQTVYRGQAFSVRVDEVEFRPGQTTRLDIVEHTGAVTILPLDGLGNIWFIRQYRHSAGETLLELPAGTLGPGEDPALGADRELQEEIGMRAGKLERLGGFWLAPGYSTEFMHVFLATALTASQLEQDEDEVITVETLPVARALELALGGELRDAKSLASLLLAARRFGW